jgi:hypothetical protein
MTCANGSGRGGAGGGYGFGLPDIATSLPLDHEGNHPRQNLAHQQHCADTKDPHQHPELSAIQLRAATHMQGKITFNQVEREWIAFRWLKVRGDELVWRQ